MWVWALLLLHPRLTLYIHRGRKEGRQLSCKGQWRLPPSTKREPRSPFFLLLSLRAYLTHSLLLLPPSSFRSLNGNDTPPFSSSFLASQFAFPGKDFFGPPRGKRGRFKKRKTGNFPSSSFSRISFIPSLPLLWRSGASKQKILHSSSSLLSSFSDPLFFFLKKLPYIVV